MLLTITLLSIIALILFGIGDYAIGRSGRNLNPHIVNFVLQLLLFLTVTPVALSLGMSMDSFDSLVTIAIGIIFGFGFIWFIKAMARGPMGVAAPIVNASAIVTLLVSLAFFGVALSTTAVLALMLVGIGAVLLTFTRDSFKGKFLHSETAKLAAIAMIIHGVSFAFLTPIIERQEWYEVLFMMEFGMLLAAAAIMFGKFAKKTSELKVLFTKQIMVAIVAGVITGLGSIIMFWAGGIDNNLVLPFVLTSASPLVTSIIAFFLDKERISLINRIGAAVVVLGMVVLNL
jgi:drug/metabolite transporter (DMT)-like permease